MSVLLLLSACCAAVRAAHTKTSLPAAVTIEQAVSEAIQNNPSLFAERLGIPVAEAAVITAGLRPNPVVSVSSDRFGLARHRAFNDTNGAGPRRPRCVSIFRSSADTNANSPRYRWIRQEDCRSASRRLDPQSAARRDSGLYRCDGSQGATRPGQ